MVLLSCTFYNFVIPWWILKLFGRNVNHHRTLCHAPGPHLKGQGHIHKSNVKLYSILVSKRIKIITTISSLSICPYSWKDRRYRCSAGVDKCFVSKTKPSFIVNIRLVIIRHDPLSASIQRKIQGLSDLLFWTGLFVINVQDSLNLPNIFHCAPCICLDSVLAIFLISITYADFVKNLTILLLNEGFDKGISTFYDIFHHLLKYLW